MLYKSVVSLQRYGKETYFLFQHVQIYNFIRVPMGFSSVHAFMCTLYGDKFKRVPYKLNVNIALCEFH